MIDEIIEENCLIYFFIILEENIYYYLIKGKKLFIRFI